MQFISEYCCLQYSKKQKYQRVNETERKQRADEFSYNYLKYSRSKLTWHCHDRPTIEYSEFLNFKHNSF